MDAKSWRGAALAAVFTLAALCTARAEDDKPIDGGKAEEFKGKAFDLKAKEKARIALTFPEGKKAAVSVKSEKETDVHLFVYDADKKEVAKDDSPGPTCDLTFTPKQAGKYVLVVINQGPGSNRCTLKVSFSK